MYNRTIGEQTLTFGVSGLLFRDGLVMFDRETDTLWTHVDGQAAVGPFRIAQVARQARLMPLLPEPKRPPIRDKEPRTTIALTFTRWPKKIRLQNVVSRIPTHP